MDTTTNMIEIWQTLNIILNQDITTLNLSNPFQNRVYQRLFNSLIPIFMTFLK